MSLKYQTGKFIMDSFYILQRKASKMVPKSRVIDGVKSYLLDNRVNDDCPIVFIHGFGDDMHSFCRTAFFFKHKRCLLIELPGFGESERPKDWDYSFDGYSQWVKKLLDDLKVDQCHLVGNSLGGGIALKFTLDFQDCVKSLTLVDSAGVLPPSESFYHRLLRGDNVFDVPHHDDFKEFRKKIIKRKLIVPGSIDLYLGKIYASRNDWHAELMRKLKGDADKAELNEKTQHLAFNDRLGEIEIPTLIIWGELDELFPVEVGEILHRDIPQSHFKVFKGVGHCLQHEYPYKLAREIKKYLNI